MKRKRDSESEPYPTDFHDDFETDLAAIQHIEPILYRLAVGLGKKKEDLIIYDPYFCKGGVRDHFERLGFMGLIHAKRDFYKDIKEELIPDYDVLVTNPAYSSDHKEKCLSFCFESNRPFILLLPNYVATKSYYQELLSSHLSSKKAIRSNQGSDKQAAGHISSPFYLVPKVKYEYHHPEGAGLSSSPFFSIWYIYLNQEWTGKVYHWLEKKLKRDEGSQAGATSRVLKTTNELKEEGAAPSWKRLNPRQRKAAKKAKGKEEDGRI